MNILEFVFNSPFYRSASVLSRLAVNAACVIWAVIVLCKEDALVSSHAYYAWITEYIDEDIVAAAILILASSQTVWLVMKWPAWTWKKFPVGCSGYGLLAAAWSFVLFSVALGPGPIQPTATATVSVITALAFYAFISNPRQDG